MKRIFRLIFFAFLFSQGLYAQPVNLKFNMLDAPAGKVKLIGTYGDQYLLADSTYTDAQGWATFRKDTLYPGGFYYIVWSDNSVLYTLLDKDQDFSISTTKANWIADSKVEGSLDNDLYYQNLRFEQKWKPRIDSVTGELNKTKYGTPDWQKWEKARQQVEGEKEAHLQSFTKNYPTSFFTKFKTQGQNPKWQDLRKPNGDLDTMRRFFTFRNEYWSNYDFSDDRLIRTPVYYNKLNNFISQYTPQDPDSINAAADFVIRKCMNNDEYYKYTVNFIALKYKTAPIMDREKVYSHIIESYVTYDKAKWADSSDIKRVRADAANMKGSFLGNIGQDLNCKDENGNFVSLYGLNTPWTIVYIYHPDCEHCQKETPKLIQFYNEWKSRGVGVYALTSEIKDQQKWVNYKNKTGMPFPAVWDPKYDSGFYYKYYIDITPEIYLLDPDHRIVAKNLSVDQLQEALEREMKKRQ